MFIYKLSYNSRGLVKHLTVLLLSVLVICTFSKSSRAGSQLNWIGQWQGEDKRELLVREIKKEFEFLYPEIELNFIFPQELDAPGNIYKWKVAHTIVRMIQSGKIDWDVVFLDFVVYNHVAELLGDPDWGPKYIVDLSAEHWFQQSQKAFILNTPHYRNQTGGILIGPYIEGFIACLWYNQNVAHKAGIHVQERKMTVNDLFSYAEQLATFNKNNNSSIPFIKLGVLNRIEVLFEYLFKSHFDNPEFAIAESCNRDKELAFLDTLCLFERLSKFQPILNEDYQTLKLDPWRREFLNGDGLFLVAGTYMYSHFQGIDPEKYKDVIPIEAPSTKQPNGLVGDYCTTFAIMKGSKNKKAAINLLKLWSEPKIAEKWISYTKNPTGLKGHLDDPVSKALHDDVYNKFIMEMTEQYKDMPMRYFRVPSYVFGTRNPITPSEFRSKLALILAGKLSAEDYFHDVMTRYHER